MRESDNEEGKLEPLPDDIRYELSQSLAILNYMLPTMHSDDHEHEVALRELEVAVRNVRDLAARLARERN